MVTVGLILAVVAVVLVIVLLYKWPDIFGRTHNEYFENPHHGAPPPNAPPVPGTTTTLPINSMSQANLLQAIAVPDIKSLEGFQNSPQQRPANPIAGFNDGNGNANNNQIWDGGVGNGYGSNRAAQAMAFTSGPLAGTRAGAGPLLTPNTVPAVADTSATIPRPIPPSAPNQVVSTPAFSTTGTPVLNTGPVVVGDISVTPSAREENLSTPAFTVSESLVDHNAINKLKTNLASGGHYTVNVTSNLPNVSYSFPLLTISDVADSANRTYAFRFGNNTMAKQGTVFYGAKTLGIQVVQTAPLPMTAPNAPAPPVSRQQQPPSAVLSGTQFTVATCKTLGYPSLDNNKRLFSLNDCNTLSGIWKATGECLYPQGGSWSTLCNTNNPPKIKENANPNILIRTPLLTVGDVKTGPYITEIETAYPAFIINSTVVDPAVINKIKTNLASMTKYMVIVTGDAPGLLCSFALEQISDSIGQADNYTFAYTFMNHTLKRSVSMKNAKKMSLQVIQLGPLPPSAPNAQLATHPLPTPPNNISSQPPSTANSILPKTTTVSPINPYQFTSQSSIVDAHTLANKIRNAEIMIKAFPT
jgi:hypothetical protein